MVGSTRGGEGARRAVDEREVKRESGVASKCAGVAVGEVANGVRPGVEAVVHYIGSASEGNSRERVGPNLDSSSSAWGYKSPSSSSLIPLSCEDPHFHKLVRSHVVLPVSSGRGRSHA